MREIWTRKDLTDRSRVFLAASVGEIPVTEACQRLGITRQRFYELEDRAVLGFLDALAPKKAGRPRKNTDPTSQIREELEDLRQENKKLWLYIKVLQKLAGIQEREKKPDEARRQLDVEVKRMILETGRDVQDLGSDLMGYLRVIGVSPSTYGFWTREQSGGRLIEVPPKPPTQEELKLWAEIREKMRDLGHRRHYTFGLNPLLAQYRGRISREKFREMAREVRAEVKRERRNNLLRYEFLHPDVAHSLDFVELPPGAQYPGKRYMARILDDCTRCTLWKAVTEHKGMYVGAAAVQKHFETGCVPLFFKFDLEFAHAEFERLLLTHKVVPLPNPPGYPPFNGKNERANKDVQAGLQSFGPEQDWTTEELQMELQFCFEELDEISERAMFGGTSRRRAYEGMKRVVVDRGVLLSEATDFRRQLLMRPNNKLSAMQAWRVSAKEMLKKYGLVRYSRPQGV